MAIWVNHAFNSAIGGGQWEYTYDDSTSSLGSKLVDHKIRIRWEP